MNEIFLAITYHQIQITQLGPVAFSLHGVFAAVGFYFGSTYAIKLCEKDGHDDQLFSDAFTWAIFGAIIGARFFTIPAHIGDPGYGLDDVFSVACSYSIMGGMSGRIIAAYLRIVIIGKAEFNTYSDYAAPALIMCIAIGRIGDLAIIEHLGRATNFVFGYEIKPGYDVAPQHNALECVAPELSCGTFHHVAMYDLILVTIFFFIFRYLQKNLNLGSGSWIGLWAIWYGVQRMILDTLRFGMGDATIGNFTWNQIGGATLAVIGLIVFLRFKNIRTG